MRRNTAMGWIWILAAAGLLAGCAKTPEDSLVKQKGAASMDKYQEATEPDAEEKETVAAGSGITEADSGSSRESASTEGAAGEALRARLQAPEQVTSEVQDATGKLKILTDAVVELPDADRLSTIAVTQHPFDQETIDRITEAFFEDAVIYDEYAYTQMTKADYQKRIEELKGYVAEGNLDPYGYGTDENGNLVYDIYKSIEAAEQNMESAPESREEREVHPQFGLAIEDEKGSAGIDDTQFAGIVCMPDGTKYVYRLSRYGSMPMEVSIKKMYSEEYWSYLWSDYNSMRSYYPDETPSEEELQQELGITVEEAASLADEKVEKLGLSGMELNAWDYQIQWKEEGGMMSNSGYQRSLMTDAGILLHYTRELDGVPVTYTEDYGGALENMDSEMETWSYERLDILVTDEGIAEVEFLNQYDIGEVQTQNVELLPFPEIKEIYEKMMLIQNADVINYESARTYRINRIALGYSRIYEPETASQSGLLVPVWNFFGSFDSRYEDETGVYDDSNVLQYQSYLTVNAVDGSVIDLGLGY